MNIQEMKAKAVQLVEKLATAVKDEAVVIENELKAVIAKIKAHGETDAATTDAAPAADATAATAADATPVTEAPVADGAVAATADSPAKDAQ